MRKRDIVEEEIQQLNRFFKRLVAKILDQEPTQNETQTLHLISDEFMHTFGVDFASFLKYSPQELILFVDAHKIQDHHLETIAKLLEELYKRNPENYTNYVDKAIELLDVADVSTKSFSIARQNKKNQLRSLQNNQIL